MKKIIPKSSVSQNEKEYIIYSEMPGVSKNNLEILLDEDVLTLKAQPSYKIKEDFKEVYQDFSFEAEFERQFILGNKVNKEAIEAKLENGLLEIKIPKKENRLGKKINVH